MRRLKTLSDVSWPAFGETPRWRWSRRCRKHVKVIIIHAHFLRRMLFGSNGQALSRQVRVMKCYRHMSLDTRQLQRTLLYRYRLAPARTNPSSFRHLLRPLHRIQLMPSQTPQVLSTEPLNTTDAKCVRKTLPARAQFRSFPAVFSLKVGQLEEDQLARPKRQESKEP